MSDRKPLLRLPLLQLPVSCPFFRKKYVHTTCSRTFIRINVLLFVCPDDLFQHFRNLRGIFSFEFVLLETWYKTVGVSDCTTNVFFFQEILNVTLFFFSILKKPFIG